MPLPNSNSGVILKRNGEFIYTPPLPISCGCEETTPSSLGVSAVPSVGPPTSRRTAGVKFFLPLYVARAPCNFPVAAVYSFVCSLLYDERGRV